MTQKRLGDGYYDQSLVRAQVAQLTGRRFLGDFTSDDEYRALMDAGVSYAKAHNLRPGIALSDALGGTISASSALVATAGRDINVETALRDTANKGSGTSGTITERVAGLYVTGEGGTLLASAGRDIKLLAGQIGSAGKDGATVINAGRNIELGTLTYTTGNAIGNASARKVSSATEAGSQITAAGGIALQAGADINLRAANVEAGGALTAQAGNNINIMAGATTNEC